MIPVVRDSGQFQFVPLSLPTLLATLWLWVPFSYYMYVSTCWPTVVADPNATATTNTTNSKRSSSLDGYLFQAFLVAIFLLILLLPGLIGHFYALNGAALRAASSFAWPRRGWLLVRVE